MRLSQSALLGFLTAVGYSTTPFVQADMTGVQTGPAIADTYAAHIMTDGAYTFYLVGNTYDPNLASNTAASSTPYAQSACFALSWYADNGASWDKKSIIGNGDSLDSCHGLGLINPQNLVLLGNSESGGLFANGNTAMSGFAAVLDKESLDPDGGTIIQMSEDGKIPYPISVASDGRTGIYVAALTSTDSQFSTQYTQAINSNFPNWIQYEKYGSSFDMTIMRFDFSQPDNGLGMAEGPPILTRTWHKEFPVDPENGILPRVYLGGIIVKNNDFLITVGSTYGKGDGYGGAVDDDEDGFISLLDLQTGELLTNRKNQERIGSDKYDVITGICDNPNDPNSFYIVGATRGDVDGIQGNQLDIQPGSLQAFIKKVSLETLHGIWTVQWGAAKGTSTTSAFALSCAVVGDLVYVAGEVDDGAGMVQGYSIRESNGDDDIWVAQLKDNGETYEVNWMRQIGTDGRDHLARYGGIVADEDGNAVIFGDTTGSLLRTRGNNEQYTDAFIMTLDKDYVSPQPPVPAPVTPVAPQVPAQTGDDVDMTGVQTGPAIADTYAAHLMTDGAYTFYLVGNTYDPNLASNTAASSTPYAQSACFALSWYADDGASWDKKSIIGNGDSLDSCHGLGLIDPQNLVLLGNSESGGLFANGNTAMSGFAAVLDKESLDPDGGTIIQMSEDGKIPYPISVASDGRTGIYVAALTSTDSQLSSQFNEAINSNFPNWIQYEKYGSSFDMTIMRFDFSQPVNFLGATEGPPMLSRTWHKEFPVDPENGILPRVYLGGIIVKNNDFLITVGSTYGKGDGYGSAVDDDEDGFISLLDLQTGELLTNRKNQERIGSDKYDVITGICDNPNDPNSFYIVGATRGDVDGIQDKQLDIQPGSLQAFIKKVSLETLHGIWTVQWGAAKGTSTTSAFALSCAVTGSTVYVAGQVEAGAGMVQGYSIQDSKGDDDIWVAQLKDYGETYEVNWMRQIGTDGRDHLARYGGIVADEDGNAVIFGDTTGSLLRTRGNNEQYTDAFIMTLYKNYAAPLEGDGVGVVTDTGIEGIQSGPSAGASYAAGMVYDGNDQIFFVGSTYAPDLLGSSAASGSFSQSNCFIFSIDLDDWQDGYYEFDSTAIFGDATILETCHGLGLIDPNTLLMVGDSEPGGLFADDDPDMSGFAATLDKNFLNLGSGLRFPMSSSSKIPYPISVASDGDSTAFVVSLTSTDDSLSSFYNQAIGSTFPNWIEYEKYGSSFDMSITRLDYVQPQDSLGVSEPPVLDVSWHKEFPVNPETNGVIPRVYVGGAIIKQTANRKFLIVAGSTRGLGVGYGDAEGDDEDGYLTFIDMETGELLQGQKNQERIGSDQDDLVTGICHDPADPDFFYVVGATKGDVGGIQPNQLDIESGSLQGFIKKMSVSNLHGDGIWTVQWGATKGSEETYAFALDCVVSDDTVYVAGNVEGGAGMVQGMEVMESKGGDDIWVARIVDLGDEFSLKWMQQLGTDGDDHLARYGGILADRDGGAIVYGDTTGSMFRNGPTDSESADIFVLRLDRGEFKAPVAPPVAGTPPVPPPPTPAPVLPPTEPPHDYTPIGVQYSGPLYAGGLIYDSSLDRCMITGATYGDSPTVGSKSSCYVATVSMNSGDLLSRELYGKFQTDEACSSLAFSPIHDTAYAIGGTEQNGFLTVQSDVNPATQYGMILQVSERSELLGYGIDDTSAVQYPISVVTDPNGDYIYVASMVSDQTIQASSPSDDFPNWTSGGDRKYGKDFYLVVKRYDVAPAVADAQVSRTVLESWSKTYKFNTLVAGLGGLIVSDMVLAGGGEQLVVVGSTRQSGGPFGNNDGTDMDGWILKLDTGTGDLSSVAGERSSIRVDDASQADDWINAVCVDRFDQDSIYIVGATDEPLDGYPNGATHAFVAKIDLAGLTRVWRVHLPLSGSSAPQATALGCAVTPDDEGGKVYVVGNILNGAVLADSEEGISSGKDDIFIVQFDASNGDIQWIRQVGSQENDRVAFGEPVTTDADGNAIVYGETYGSLYFRRTSGLSEPTSDTFLMTFSKIDGSYKAIVAQGGESHTGADDLTAENPPANSADAEEYDPGYLPDNVVALQTGPDIGPSYAGGMVYDSFSNALYVTGATYGSFSGPGVTPLPQSACFFGVVILPKLQWKERETYGTRDVAEACSSLSLTKYEGNDAAIVVGSTEENGLLTKLGLGNKAEQYGFALDLANSGGKYNLVGGALMDGSNVQYPIAVVAEDEQVWIVSMASKDSKITADFEKVSNNDYPNLTTGGIEKYGSQYTIVVEKHSMNRSPQSDGGAIEEETLTLQWRKPFETADMESVFVSGMIRTARGDEIVVVGSTRGSPGGDDMDGVMAKVSADDGSFVFEESGSRAVAYFASVTGRDDWILNACTDPDDEAHFYIVGATKGRIDQSVTKSDQDLTVHAVMAKMKLDTLTAVWTKQYTVIHQSGRTDKEAAAAALSCSVIPDQEMMYVAGVVENGATIRYEEEQISAGGDDIFVSLVSTRDGVTKWLKQVGSNGDDRLARGGGVVVDANKNAVVFGDTTGSFFRSRSQDADPLSSDIFMMVFDFRDGNHLPPLKGPPLPTITTAPPKEWYPYQYNFKDPKLLAFAITALVLLATSFICCLVIRRRQQKKLDAQKTSIFTYLQQFDVEDIDLRKSPPGGWHGTYLNKLAYGINKGESNNMADDSGAVAYETAPLTHSSVVTDSLFMDTTSAPTLGYKDHPEDPTYDDFQPRTYEDRTGNIKARDII